MATTHGDKPATRLEECSELFACPICLERMEQPVVVTPCVHRFCQACFDSWKRDHPTCPMCRQRVTGSFRDRMVNEVMHSLQEMRITPEQKLTAEQAAYEAEEKARREHERAAYEAVEQARRDKDKSDYDNAKKFKMHSALPESQLPGKICQRCRYYPACRVEDCPYVHPSVPCRAYPSCPFDSRCLYLHPCRFGAACKRTDCAYQHDAKPPESPSASTAQKTGGKKWHRAPAAVPSASLPVPVSPRLLPPPLSRLPSGDCLYAAKCTRPGCALRHPDCRFGTRCTLRDKCRFYHAPSPALSAPRRRTNAHSSSAKGATRLV